VLSCHSQNPIFRVTQVHLKRNGEHENETMIASPPPAGVYVPVPTFFVSRTAQNYNAVAAPLDLETQARHSLHLAKSGITGLVLLGSTGEAVHLSDKERFEVLSAVRKAFDGGGFKEYPLIAGTAAQNIEVVVEQLKSAKEAGCQWGLCLVPGYFAGASTQQGIIQWFTAVADQSPIPVMMRVLPPFNLIWWFAYNVLVTITLEFRTTSKLFRLPTPYSQNTRISLAASCPMEMSRIMLRLERIPILIIPNSIPLQDWDSNFCQFLLWDVPELLMELRASSQNL
jgi:hypothetical protein